MRTNRTMPSNIAKSRFRRGEYVGYGSYASYAIRKGGRGWETGQYWGHNEALPRSLVYFTARTLAELSDKLCATRTHE